MDPLASTQQLQDTMWNTLFAPFVPWFWLAVVIFFAWAAFVMFGQQLAIELFDMAFPNSPWSTRRRLNRISRDHR